MIVDHAGQSSWCFYLDVSFLWLQLMMLVTLKLRWHQLKWRQKRAKKACKRTSTPNPRPPWNSWQNSHVSLKRMEQSRLGMLQWVHQTLGLGTCPLCGSPNLLPLFLPLTELAVSGVSWQKWLLILQLNAPADSPSPVPGDPGRCQGILHSAPKS